MDATLGLNPLLLSDFAWRNSRVLVASSKSYLINTNISEAIRPADHSTLITVEIDKHGSVAFAVSVEDPKAPPALPAPVPKKPDFKTDKFHITRSILKVADEIPVSQWGKLEDYQSACSEHLLLLFAGHQDRLVLLRLDKLQVQEHVV